MSRSLSDYLQTVPVAEKIFFTQNFAVMLKSGVAATRALSTLAAQTENGKFRRILSEVLASVEKGKGLAESLSPHPAAFSSIYVNMVAAAEQSGQLEQALAELADQMKKSHKLSRQVKGALMYPAAVFCAMVAIGFGMLVFVVPQIVGIFSEMNIQLPLATRLLISLSANLNKNIWLVLPGLIGLIILLVFITRRGVGQRLWHGLILRLPAVKTIVRKINLAKISRTLSSLLAADLPIVKALVLTAATVKNAHFRESLLKLSEGVEKGKNMSALMPEFANLYPPLVQQMLAVGEESGAITKVLKDLADFYEEDVEQTMESLPSLIEPVLIIVLGAAIGGMAIAIILPMFKITEAV